jgi:hypothetical protein
LILKRFVLPLAAAVLMAAAWSPKAEAVVKVEAVLDSQPKLNNDTDAVYFVKKIAPNQEVRAPQSAVFSVWWNS